MRNDSRPRTCNTGAQNTSETDLRACVDWVQATFKIVKPDQLINDVLGLKIEDFQEANGQFGYQKCKRLDNISIFYDGSEGMGIHLQMSGQGCRLYEALTKYENPWVSIFSVFLRLKASFSRLDVAVDDFEGYFKIDQVVKKIKKGELVSKFKKARSMESIEIKTGDSKGMTIYYGSAKSRIQIRMYEKNFERENAGYELEKDVTCWNRTEVQARNERAQSIAEIIANDGEVGDVVKGILSYYLRFTVKGKDMNKARWKTAPFWEKFLGNVEKLKLTKKAPDRTVERMEQWLEKQVAPSLAVLMEAHDGDVGKLYKMITQGNTRLKDKDHEMVARFKRQNKSLDLGQDQRQQRSI